MRFGSGSCILGWLSSSMRTKGVFGYFARSSSGFPEKLPRITAKSDESVSRSARQSPSSPDSYS